MLAAAAFPARRSALADPSGAVVGSLWAEMSGNRPGRGDGATSPVVVPELREASSAVRQGRWRAAGSRRLQRHWGLSADPSPLTVAGSAPRARWSSRERLRAGPCSPGDVITCPAAVILGRGPEELRAALAASGTGLSTALRTVRASFRFLADSRIRPPRPPARSMRSIRHVAAPKPVSARTCRSPDARPSRHGRRRRRAGSPG